MEQSDFGRDLERFLDRVLLAAHDQKSNKQARSDLQALMKVHAEIRSQHQAPIDKDSYRLGATVVLQKLFIRIVERKEGNRTLDLVRRRKHVANLLQILARARIPVMPSELAERLGIPQPAVTVLLKETDAAGLTKEATAEDGRYRPRIITSTGKTILNAFRPTWALDMQHESDAQMTKDGVVVLVRDTAETDFDVEILSGTKIENQLVKAFEQVVDVGSRVNVQCIGYVSGYPVGYWRESKISKVIPTCREIPQTPHAVIVRSRHGNITSNTSSSISGTSNLLRHPPSASKGNPRGLVKYDQDRLGASNALRHTPSAKKCISRSLVSYIQD